MLTGLLDTNRLITLAILLVTSMPIHEWAHAWTAFQLGDDTAARQGRLTINPLSHLDQVGTFSLLLFGFGWGKPVPVNPYRLRGDWRRNYALVSIAGPFSNLILAMLGAIPFRLGWLTPYGGSSVISPQRVLVQFISINLILMVFNLIPFPPLDGSRVLTWLLPQQWAAKFERLEQFGGPGLMLVLFLLSRVGILGMILNPFMNFMFRALLVY